MWFGVNDARSICEAVRKRHNIDKVHTLSDTFYWQMYERLSSAADYIEELEQKLDERKV